MSAKQLLRIALVLLGAMALWGALAVAKRSHRDTPAALVLPRLDTAAVTRVEFTKGADTVALVKAGQGWTVNGFTAAPGAMPEFFSALSDSGASSELVAQNPVLHQRLGVDSAGRKVVITAGDSTVATFLVGNRGPDFDGFYVRRADAPEVFLAHARWAEIAGRTVEDWRNKQIAKLAADSIGGIEVTRGARRFALVKKTGWTFAATGQPADSAATSRVVAAFADVRALGFPSAPQADSLRKAKPWRRVRVTAASGSPLFAVTLDSTAAGIWLRQDADSVIYRIDRSLADAIAPAESLLVRKK